MTDLHFQNDFEADLESNLKYFFETSKKFPTELIEGWLIFRGKLPRISPIIEFKMNDPITGVLTEFYICNNRQYSFNKKGLSPAGYKPGGIRRFMFDTLMEAIQVPSKNINSKIKVYLEEGLSKALGIQGKINVQLVHYYRLKYDKILIDHIMEQIFWDNFAIKKARWKFHWKNNKNPVLKRIHDYFSNKSQFDESHLTISGLDNSIFTVYLNDQYLKIRQMKTEILSNNLDVYNRNNFLQLYRLLLSHNHKSIVQLNTAFTYQEICSQSNETDLGK